VRDRTRPLPNLDTTKPQGAKGVLRIAKDIPLFTSKNSNQNAAEREEKQAGPYAEKTPRFGSASLQHIHEFRHLHHRLGELFIDQFSLLF
jgi:hypothetical protein